MKELSKNQIGHIARKLYDTIGIELSDDNLAIEALTHPSFTHETDVEMTSYDRLEFLGDGVVNLVVAEELMLRLPNLEAGMLTQLRARIIRKEGLLKVARLLHLGDLVLLGAGEEQTGGRKRESTLADMVESITAAVYLDKGFDVARELVLRLVMPQIETVIRDRGRGNPKGQLQELCLRRFSINPAYKTVGTEGPPHEPIFDVEVWIQGEKPLGRGQGSSRRAAQEAAALNALELLTEDQNTPSDM